MNAPRCHTYLEIIYTRYGVLTHWVFIFFALLTNVLVSSQLLLGGSAVVTSLTGMNVYAAIFLIPLGVCVYVVLGGLRATFLCKTSRKRLNVPTDLIRRLFAYTNFDGHNPLFYVRYVCNEFPDWIHLGYVSSPQRRGPQTSRGRQSGWVVRNDEK